MVAGCSIPRKEFGQKSVPAVPEKPEEPLKRVVAATKDQVDLAYRISLTNAYTNLYQSLGNSVKGMEIVQSTVGYPNRTINPASQSQVEEVFTSARNSESKFDKTMDRFADKLQPLEGKKVVGSGWFSISYLTYYALILAGLFLIYIAVKILGILFPQISLAGNVMRTSATVATKAVGEIVAGGEAFKGEIDRIFQDENVKARVLEVFRTQHQLAQDESTQKIVRKLTGN